MQSLGTFVLPVSSVNYSNLLDYKQFGSIIADFHLVIKITHWESENDATKQGKALNYITTVSNVMVFNFITQ